MGKHIDHNREYLINVGANLTKLPHLVMHQMIDLALDSVAQWNQLAKQQEVPKQLRQEINQNLALKDFE